MAESRLIVAESDDSLALCWLKESIDYFILTYMKAREELKGKKPNVVKITSSDVRICAEQMRHEGLSWEKTKEKEAEFASIINTEKNTVTNAETEINAGTNTEKTDIGTNTEKRTNTGTNTETRKNTGMSTGTKTENGTQKKNGNSKNVRRRRRRKKPETGNGAS
jgi:hypothetical protein